MLQDKSSGFFFRFYLVGFVNIQTFRVCSLVLAILPSLWSFIRHAFFFPLIFFLFFYKHAFFTSSLKSKKFDGPELRTEPQGQSAFAQGSEMQRGERRGRPFPSRVERRRVICFREERIVFEKHMTSKLNSLVEGSRGATKH